MPMPAAACCAADYLIIVIIGGLMTFTNLYGYFKCSREAADEFKAMTGNLMSKVATTAVTSSMASSRV